MVRRIVFGLAAVALALTAVSAHAQAMPTASAHVSSISVGAAYSNFSPDYADKRLSGITAYLDANITRHWGVELETHQLRHNPANNNMNEITYQMGPRLTFGKRFQPYAKAMIGGGVFNYPSPPTAPQGKFFVWSYGGGLDIPVGSRLTVRPVDFELQKWPGFGTSSLGPMGFSFGASFKLWKAHQ